MLKSLWKKLFSSPKVLEDTSQGLIVPRQLHSVSRKNISINALKVLNRLQSSHFDAFLVGGGVRDILLGHQPKDFDIATNATPEQIKKLFRNCRIIGRRFKLAHILFGPEIIEVATFRATHNDESPHGEQAESGMLVRDNVFGSIQDDAWRRDFTINALYYSSDDFTVRDFTGGLKDLEKRQLRLIGDPDTRYREDPVRMLRAIRLASKLDLTIEKKTAQCIKPNVNLLNNVSSARLWDESHKIFLAGRAEKTFEQLIHYGLLHSLFPSTQSALENDNEGIFRSFIFQALKSTDLRVQSEKPVTPAFLYAVFLWQPLLNTALDMHQKGLSLNDAYHKAMSIVIGEQNQFIAIPKRFSLVIRDIWALQTRLEKRNHRSLQILEHPKFRAAYDFLVLRSQDSTGLKALADWWTTFQFAKHDEQRKMINGLKGSRKKGKHFKPRNNKRRRPPIAKE